MTTQPTEPTGRTPITSAADIDLNDWDFWGRPDEEREHAFRLLRDLDKPAFFPEPEFSLGGITGPGYHALVRHADILEASRNPEVFCSGDGGATNIPDLPAEFAEYFGSMINMDDPRHARLRRIVSRAFTPRMIKQFESDVDVAASRIVDELLETGPGCDFVTEVAARLPLKIICDMMGIPEKDYRGADLLEELLQRQRRGDADLEDVTFITRDAVARLDGGQIPQPFRRVVRRGGVDRLDRNERGQRKTDLVVVHESGVGTDDTALFQPAYPLVHGGDRQPGLLGQIGEAHPAVSRQQRDNSAIDLLHLSNGSAARDCLVPKPPNCRFARTVSRTG
jgi:hypothetical protein